MGLTPMALDFETYYGPGFSLSEKNPATGFKWTTAQYVLDPRFQVIGVAVWYAGDQSAHWENNHNDRVGEYLRKFDWSDKIVFAHNAWFDATILEWRYGIRPAMWVCTSAMAKPYLGPFCGTSLAKVMETWQLGQKGDEVVHAFGKRLEDFTPEDLRQYGNYCENDTMGCVKAFYTARQLGYRDAELRVLDATVKMYTRPILQLDKPMLYHHLQDVQANKEKLLLEAGVDKDTLMSNERLAAWFDEMGYEYPKKWSEKKQLWVPAFSKQDQEFVAMQESDDELLANVVSARLGVKSTLEETRTQKLILMADWPAVPIYLNYYGAQVTGRFSGGEGVNWQNNGRKSPIRKAIMAPPGYVIVAGDSSQIELRVNMAQSAMYAEPNRYDEEETLGLLRAGGDVYCDFASSIYGRAISKADNDERFVGKVGQLSLGYQGGPGALARALWAQGKLKMPEDERKRVVRTYRNRYTGVKNHWEAWNHALGEMIAGRSGRVGFVHYDGHGVILPNGMRIWYPSLSVEDGEYGPEFFYMQRDPMKRGNVFKKSKLYGGKITENVTQALAQIIVKYQMAALAQVFQIVKQVHDEIVMVVPVDQQTYAVNAMKDVMTRVPEWAKSIPIACEVGAAVRYGDC